jgi:hypothetical protein
VSNPTPAIDVEKRIGQYVTLRDKIKALEENHKKSLAPYKDMLEMLGNVVLKHMQDTNVGSVKTDEGTAYITERTSVSLQDPEAFMAYVIANKEFDLLDQKANPTAVDEHIKRTGGLPPGAKFSRMVKIGVRRANEKED